MEQITSRHNAVIQHLKKLASSGAYRRQQGEFLCEGPKLWQEAAAQGWQVGTVLACREETVEACRGLADRAALVPQELLAYAADAKTPQGLLFTCRLPQPRPGLPGKRLLVLDGVQDPGNVGTIWRTADAFGADGLVLLGGCADPWLPKTVRATMGACFRLPLLQTDPESLSQLLAQEDIPLYAAALGPGTEDVRRAGLGRAALVIGSEGRGVSQEVLERCRGRLTIPMRQRCESLNAAVAAGILLWESWGRTLDESQ